MKKIVRNFMTFIHEIFVLDKRYFLYYIVTILLKAGSPFALVIIPRYILNEIMGLNRLNYIISYLCAMGLINITIYGLLGILEPKLNNRINHLRARLSENLSAHILNMDYEYMENAQIIDQKQKAIEFVYGNVGLNNFTFLSQSLIIGIIQVFGYVYLLLTVSPVIIIAILFVAVLNAYFQGKAEKYSYDAEMEVMRPNRQAGYIDFIASDFGHIKDIKLYNIQHWILGKKKYYANIKLAAFDRSSNKFVRLGIITSLTNNLLNISVYIYLILRLTWNTLLIGDFTMYLSAITNFSDSISNVFSSAVKFQNINLYLTNYLEFRKIKNRIQTLPLDKPAMLSDIKEYSIRFENVWFQYPGQDTYALKGISTEIKQNERVSVVGKNGAGKTTFIKLLVHLYDPTEGNIYIGDVNIKDIPFDEYLKLISVVFQDYKLFAFSMKENVAFENVDRFEDEECIKLFEQVGLREKLSKLKKGVHTGLGKQFDEEGTDVSGGEAQKIAIARAAYKKAPIVVLDEPTSALDPLSEYEIYKCFDDLVKDCSSIYISHRLSSTKFSDRIIVFGDGEILEEGSHDELMKKNGMYKEMFDKQAQYYIRDDKDVRDE